MNTHIIRPPVCILMAGLNASGKTTIARHLCEAFSAVALIDKDDQALEANRTITARLRELADQGNGINLYDTDEYRSRLRPAIYREVFQRARSEMTERRSCVIDAPFGSEAKNPNFPADVAQYLQFALTTPPDIRFFWVKCSAEKLETNMRTRNAERDAPKTASPDAWQRYISGIDFEFTPAFDHHLIDTTEGTVEDHAVTIAQIVGLTPPVPL